jgi:hypothetical protein
MTLDRVMSHLRPTALASVRNWQQKSCETFAGIGVVSLMLSIMARIEPPLGDTLVLKVVRLVCGLTAQTASSRPARSTERQSGNQLMSICTPDTWPPLSAIKTQISVDDAGSAVVDCTAIVSADARATIIASRPTTTRVLRRMSCLTTGQQEPFSPSGRDEVRGLDVRTR